MYEERKSFSWINFLIKAIIAVIVICAAIGVGQITWTGIKNAWIEYYEGIKPTMDKFTY